MAGNEERTPRRGLGDFAFGNLAKAGENFGNVRGDEDGIVLEIGQPGELPLMSRCEERQEIAELEGNASGIGAGHVRITHHSEIWFGHFFRVSFGTSPSPPSSIGS